MTDGQDETQVPGARKTLVQGLVADLRKIVEGGRRASRRKAAQ
ncbi:hypothetical protein [Epibacterium ulvae]|nr:hypothetical protein [Epibacterium ulvae]